MSVLKQLAVSGSAAQTPTYIDDVFSSYPYTGTGATQSIVNGIDLSTKGGLTWIKQRSGSQDHVLFDTVRGVNKYVRTNSTGIEQSGITDLLTVFNTNGFTIGADASTAGVVNASGSTYSSWSFRESSKFFDVVTYTGDGSTSKTVTHNLGQQVGMIAVKRLDGIGAWTIYHTSLGNTTKLAFTTAAQITSDASVWASTSPTTTSFTVGDNTLNNVSSANYVAYVFAHNTATDGLIQCGSYTGTGTAGINVTLGWEPQAVLVKRATGGTGSWYMIDSTRVMSSTDTSYLTAEAVSGESSFGSAAIVPTATGFRVDSADTGLNASSGTYIYMAIRRSNKPPTSGTQVYNAAVRTGTGVAFNLVGVGFSPDVCWTLNRNGAWINGFQTKLIGSEKYLSTSQISGLQLETTHLSKFNVDGVSIGTGGITNSSGDTYVYQFFKRAAGVFDLVYWVGSLTTNGTQQSVNHNLGVIPELVITKRLDTPYAWEVTGSILGSNGYMRLNTATIKDTFTGSCADTFNIFQTAPWNVTTTTGGLTTDAGANSASYLTELYATKAGVSKVGSYTGNGSSQNIDCGFASGARFIMIKRTNTTGDWYIWDTVRGIVAGNDPHLSLNTSASEVTTDDSIDPLAAGFIVNQVAATNINVNAATYIYLAFA